MDKILGIYKIINIIDEKYCVGSSKNINGRWNRHKSHLRRNIHWNDYLQNAWNKYGEKNFKFIIVEQLNKDTTKNELLNIEQTYLNLAKIEQDKCYNLDFKAIGHDWSEYSRNKMSKSMTGKIGILASHYGMHHSKKTKERLSLLNKGLHAGEKHNLYDKTVFKFKHRITNEQFEGTQYNFRIKYNLKQSKVNLMVHNMRKSHKDWILMKENIT